MDTSLIEQLKLMEDSNLSPYERLTRLSDYMNKQFNGNRLHDVGYLITFYNYIKNDDNYSKYSNQYKDAFSNYLKTTYYDNSIIEKDIDDLSNKNEDYLDTLIELSDDELAKNIANVAKEKIDKDANFINSYNKITSSIRKNKPNISNILVDVSTISNSVDNKFDDIKDEINNQSKKIQSKISESSLNDTLDSLSNRLPSGGDISIEKVQDELDKKAKESMDKINSMYDAAINDPNLGDSSKPSNNNEVKQDNIDLGVFGRPKVSSKADYESQMSDIQRQIKELNMQQKSIEKENEARIDAMAKEKAGELNVSKETLKKHFDKNGVSIGDIDSIVISPLMQQQIAANEAISTIDNNRFANLVKKIFNPLELKYSSLQIEQVDGKKACYIESTDKSQRVANMESKFLNIIKNNCDRKIKLSNMIVNTKNNVKEAIKKLKSKIGNINLNSRKDVSDKLHNLADRIYNEKSTENKDVLISDDHYIESPSIYDEIKMLKEHKIDGNAGNLIGEIDNPELGKSTKTL